MEADMINTEEISLLFQEGSKALNEGNKQWRYNSKLRYNEHLSEEEYQTQKNIFNNFFNIDPKTLNDNDSNNIITEYRAISRKATSILNFFRDENTMKVYHKSQDFINLCNIKDDPNKLKKNWHKFFNLKIKINNENDWEKIKQYYIEGDKHGATTLNTENTFFLGDVTDRFLLNPITKNNEDYFFQYKKLVYLILRNLWLHHKSLVKIIENKKFNSDQESHLSVLGNHDYGIILWQDLKKLHIPLINKELKKNFFHFFNRLDDCVRAYIPTQIVFIYGEKAVVLSHSGGEILLPQNKTFSNVCETEKISIGRIDYDLSNYHFDQNKMLRAKGLEENEKKLIEMQFNNFFVYLNTNISEHTANPYTWCDFFQDFDIDKVQDCMNQPINYADGRYNMNTGYSFVLHKILETNYDIENLKSILRLRGHEHHETSLKKFFKNNNYYKIIIYYLEYSTTWGYLPPAYPLENIYGKDYIENNLSLNEGLKTVDFFLKENNYDAKIRGCIENDSALKWKKLEEDQDELEEDQNELEKNQDELKEYKINKKILGAVLLLSLIFFIYKKYKLAIQSFLSISET